MMQFDSTFAVHATTLLFDVFLRSLVLILLAGLFCYLVRKGSAASRHAVWMLTLAGLLFLPAFRTFVPPLTFPGPILPASQVWTVDGIVQK